MAHLWSVVVFYFRWPYGGVWGNVWAIIPTAVITAASAWFARDRLGKALARWFVKHHHAHLHEIQRTGIKMATVRAIGEDRSDFQAIFGWTGLDFGFAKATEGLSWVGKTFAANWANLKKAGIPRGAYHFLHPSEDPKAQAQHFLNIVKAQGIVDGDMLVVDSELLFGLSRPGRSHALHSEHFETATNTQVDAA